MGPMSPVCAYSLWAGLCPEKLVKNNKTVQWHIFHSAYSFALISVFNPIGWRGCRAGIWEFFNNLELSFSWSNFYFIFIKQTAQVKIMYWWFLWIQMANQKWFSSTKSDNESTHQYWKYIHTSTLQKTLLFSPLQKISCFLNLYARVILDSSKSEMSLTNFLEISCLSQVIAVLTALLTILNIECVTYMILMGLCVLFL